MAADPEQVRELGEPIYAGSPEASLPRVPAKILPSDSGNLVSAISIVDTIDLSQKMFQYSGYDVAFGTSLDFSDLRKVPAEVSRLSRTFVEPFEEGSFVIPFVFTDTPIEVLTGSRHRRFTGRNVSQRFLELLMEIRENRDVPKVSIGMMQTVQMLSRVLRREASGIEYSQHERNRTHAVPSITIDEQFANAVEHAIEARSGWDPVEYVDEINGVITEVNMARQTFELQHDGNTIKGRYMDFLRSVVPRHLGKSVRITGNIERRGNRTTFIMLYDVAEVVDPIHD